MLIRYIASYAIDIVALLFLLVLLRQNNLLVAYRKRPFSYAIIFIVLVILAEAGTVFALGGPASLRPLNMLSNVVGFLLTPIIILSLIAVFEKDSLLRYRWWLIPTVVNGVAVVLSPWTGWIFYVDINNHYQRGSFFLIFVVVYIINIVLLAMTTLRVCKKSLYPIKWKIISLAMLTLIGTSVQILLPDLYFSWHCVTLASFLFYLLLVEFDSSFDGLTKLYNRAAFDKALAQLTPKNKFSVVVMDLNDFKDINDRYGHDYGDTVLKEVALVIKEAFRGYCSCYRTGGDEFCALCRDGDLERVKGLLKNMTDSIIKERETKPSLPTIAYGYSAFRGDEPLDLGKVIREADTQMYYHKQMHKKKNT